MSQQLPPAMESTPQFPSTRYQGSKAKLVDWIWQQLAALDFDTCLDAFGGTGSMAYRLKQAGKQVTYNDILRFNFHIGRALIENSDVTLPENALDDLLQAHEGIPYDDFIQRTFDDIYYTAHENAWLDRTIANLQQLDNPYQFSIAFFALAQACIVKRPYNLFHRKNLYIRMADVERSFGNKASWDKPFDAWFTQFVQQANQAVFDNGHKNRAFCGDVMAIQGDFDLIYIDPPYISKKGVAVDYRDFYHFLEGLTMYDQWPAQVDYKSKHRRLQRTQSAWTDKTRIHAAFEQLFARFADSTLVVSYRSDGIPTIEELKAMLRRYKQTVQLVEYGQYQYALSTNRKSQEVLLLAAC